MARALQPANNNSANNSNQEKETVVPLVTTYHLRRKDLNRLIERNLQYLYVDQVVMKVFLHRRHLFILENGASSA